MIISLALLFLSKLGNQGLALPEYNQLSGFTQQNPVLIAV